ncbi:DNA-binding MarR family transcriptional regulator [Kribbella jejuensis]|uniref:DNA-binding MarR family transcriptional regulator n=2 Tax=Kribbella jejuensis TaxID=236068 RepID=A0A542ETC1_9ACTN|nr:DNA-binding MarR family transcriptional regulator [Kribbella jejuensis]
MERMDSYEDDGCVTFLVRHAWLSMRSVLAEALDEHGLSVQQYGTLLCVRKDPGLTVAEVGRVVGTTRQSANELITGMERAGLVERRPNPKDRRTQQVHLTEGGRRRLAEAAPAIRKVENELEAAFSTTDRATARAWLAHMVTAVEG